MANSNMNTEETETGKDPESTAEALTKMAEHGWRNNILTRTQRDLLFHGASLLRAQQERLEKNHAEKTKVYPNGGIRLALDLKTYRSAAPFALIPRSLLEEIINALGSKMESVKLVPNQKLDWFIATEEKPGGGGYVTGECRFCGDVGWKQNISHAPDCPMVLHYATNVTDTELLDWCERDDNSKDMDQYFEVRTGAGTGSLRERIKAKMIKG